MNDAKIGGHTVKVSNSAVKPPPPPLHTPNEAIPGSPIPEISIDGH